MRQFATVRIAQAAQGSRVTMPSFATACCNVCRTCVTSNLIGLGMPGLSL
jgi:hypothetical protein